MEREVMELIVDAKIDNLDQVLAFVDQELEALDCSMKAQMQIDIAVEEVFVNIAHYAYTPAVGQAMIKMHLEEAESSDASGGLINAGKPSRNLVICFLDRGIPFDPLARPDPDVTLSLDERKIGGLGIYMVKKNMDEVEYEYKDGQNVLTIKKMI